MIRDAVSGRLKASVDPLGRVTMYERDETGYALQVTQAANTSQPLAVRYGLSASGTINEVTAQVSAGKNAAHSQASQARMVRTQLLGDDFGREVQVNSPDSGIVTRRYDAANRLMQVQDANGNITRLSYDVAGRLTQRAVSGKGQAEQTTSYVYEGRQLQEIRDPLQTERYSYDQQGRVASRSVTLKLVGATAANTQAQAITRYRYDAQGRLSGQTLPDGSELQLERNNQAQIVAMHRQTAAWAPFGWGRSTLVQNLSRDLIGLSAMRYGNGVQAQWQRSREGILGRVVYTQPQVGQPSVARAALEGLMAPAYAADVNLNAPADQPASAPAPGAYGIVPNPRALWDSRLLFDEAGNILQQGQFANSAAAQTQQNHYAYDGLNQLIQAQTKPGAQSHTGANAQPTLWRYHHDGLGNRLLAQETQAESATSDNTTAQSYTAGDRTADQTLDEAGRPLQAATHRYQWDAQGHLIGINAADAKTPNPTTAVYQYNQRGERISKQASAQGKDTSTHYLYNERRQRLAELNAQGKITRQYVWLADQLIAVLDAPKPIALRDAAEGMMSKAWRTAAMAWSHLTDHEDSTYYVHTNHLGAPVAMTDAQAKPVWSAHYSPFGKRLGGLQKVGLDLRLPGQWLDAETGLHHNDHRYYDPSQGRYISPDPLGLQGGLNAYAYVQNNPLGYSDPLGLVLFAFDGTGNDESDSATLSNVVKFRKLYDDGDKFYITGPGTRDPGTGIENPSAFYDLIKSITGKQRIAAMVEYLNKYSNDADDETAIDMDIIGFSRGAAQARDFANQIVDKTAGGYYRYKDKTGKDRCQKVNFRFMGLWDTVLSTHTGSYDLSIPNEFKYVAQAAALNEYRGGLVAFPLESILGVPTPAGTTRIERGFLGAHSDIGGGWKESDMAKVALAWMRDQALAAGVKMNDLADNTLIANPVIHDSSSNLIGIPGPDAAPPPPPGPSDFSEDRDVRYANGSVVKQRKTTDQVMTYADTKPFITYKGDPTTLNYVSGTVNAACYLKWLNEHGYDIKLTSSGTCP